MSYRGDLIRYVMNHGKKNFAEAEEYLDTNCPRWRDAEPPVATPVVVETEDDEND